jgi:hypothetical protein
MFKSLLQLCLLALLGAVWLPTALAAAAITSGTTETVRLPAGSLLPAKQDVIVQAQAGRFFGWPANEGLWSWGNEVLVAFNAGAYQSRSDTHSVTGTLQTLLARSLDGGKTWQLDAKRHFAILDKMHDPLQRFTATDFTSLTKPLDFTAPGFALKLRGQMFYYSQDKGHSWQGPVRLPDFGIAKVSARTDTIINGPQACMAFLSCETEKSVGRCFCIETLDGGLTWQFIAWLAPELPGPGKTIFTTMPSTLKLGSGHYITAIRQRVDRKKWTDIYESTDNGRTWNFISKPEQGGTNPASMVHLPDGRICLTYGFRGKPFGIHAKLSGDGGKTWGPPIILRDDAVTWDLGYPRSAVLPDGRVLTCYYFNTWAHPEQHIAATIWNPAQLKPATTAKP